MKTERSIRRWLWAISLLFGIAGVAGAVLRNRRLSRPAPERLMIRPVEQPTLRYREQVATGRAPTGNGVVRTERPSTGLD
ncbi:MAG: hypothetical protein WAK86_01285 [Pseudonocardiaceae bacterium]